MHHSTPRYHRNGKYDEKLAEFKEMVHKRPPVHILAAWTLNQQPLRQLAACFKPSTASICFSNFLPFIIPVVQRPETWMRKAFES